MTIEDGKYESSIPTIESDVNGIQLSSDLGTTNFLSEYKASTMMRYIRKAINNKELNKVD